MLRAIYHMASAPLDDELDPALQGVSGIEYWDIGPETAHLIEADVWLFWTDAEFSGITDIADEPQDLSFAHYDGVTWENLGGAIDPSSSVGEGGTGAIVAHMTSFSPVTFGSANGLNANPVTLLDFAAKLSGTTAHLSWITASEINNHHFEIEKSSNGMEFFKIGEVAGNGTTSEQNDYRYSDKANSGVNYYRLRQVDNDGTSAYSKVVSVNASALVSHRTIVYPNPLPKNNRVISIGLSPETVSPGSGIVITLFGPNGNLLLKNETIYNGEILTLELDGQEIKSGLHFLVVSSANGKYQSKLLIE
jgi:hypothetical protein